MKRLVAALVGVLVLCVSARAELRFAHIFGDNMVLQRDKPVRVWGWADAGAKVTVTLTEDPAVAAPHLPKKKEEPKPDTKYSVSLHYVEKNAPAFKPQTVEATADAKGAWTATLAPLPGSFTPKFLVVTSANGGAALSNILIGEVWVGSGQSNMEWPYYFHQEIEKGGAIYNGIRFTERFGSGSHPDATWYKPKDDLDRPLRWFACDPKDVDNCAAVTYAFAKALHFYLKVPVGIVNNARGGTTVDAWCDRAALDRIEDAKVKKILSNYDVRAARWETEEGRQAVIVEAKQAFEAGELARWKQETEKAQKEGKKLPKQPEFHPPQDPRKGWSEPSGMYNGVVLPIGKLSFRGVLWYQGENNFFGRWTQFQHMFPHLVPSFRKAYGDPELPVAVFDLAGGMGDSDESVEKSCVVGGYAVLRDAMTRYTDKDPRAWLIPTYDLGHQNIHPQDKLPAGLRAACWALSRIYGEKNIPFRGPKFKEMKKAGNVMQVFFEPDSNLYDWMYKEDRTYVPVTFQGYAQEHNIRGFAIAAADRRWYPAKAKANLKGRCLEVWSDLVPDPVAVRYGWASLPDGNLCGGEWHHNLPVPTFRTDDWPIPASFGREYDPAFESAVGSVIQFLNFIADSQVPDRKIRQAFVDIEQNIEKSFGRNPELKKEVAELKVLRTRIEEDLAKEVKAAKDLRMGNSPNGLESKIPGYTKEYLGQ